MAVKMQLSSKRHSVSRGQAGSSPRHAVKCFGAGPIPRNSHVTVRCSSLAQPLPGTCQAADSMVHPPSLIGAAVRAWHGSMQLANGVVTRLRSSVTPESVQQGLAATMRNMRMFAVVAPFAAMDMSAGNFATNIWLPFWQALFGFTNFYLFILFMRVLLSWFPALDWSRNPWLIVKVITDPYLNVFRNLIPALFMAIDLTPLLGFMLLQDFVAILENCVVENLFSDTIDEPTSDAFAYMPPDFTRFVTKPV